MLFSRPSLLKLLSQHLRLYIPDSPFASQTACHSYAVFSSITSLLNMGLFYCFCQTPLLFLLTLFSNNFITKFWEKATKSILLPLSLSWSSVSHLWLHTEYLQMNGQAACIQVKFLPLPPPLLAFHHCPAQICGNLKPPSQ